MEAGWWWWGGGGGLVVVVGPRCLGLWPDGSERPMVVDGGWWCL